jgi:hypothetical protein
MKPAPAGFFHGAVAFVHRRGKHHPVASSSPFWNDLQFSKFARAPY